MATYCDCGHVSTCHIDADVNEETGEVFPAWCIGDDLMSCECDQFTEVPATELARGYD